MLPAVAVGRPDPPPPLRVKAAPAANKAVARALIPPMKHLPILALTALLALLGACQQTPVTEQTTATPSATPPPTSSAATEGEARAVLARYIQQQPQADRYQVDSARLVEVDAVWQAMVPRTDWKGRMPNAAAFEIDKLTGQVRVLPVR